MNNEPNKPIPAQELTEKELESITGGVEVKKIILIKTYCDNTALTIQHQVLLGSN